MSIQSLLKESEKGTIWDQPDETPDLKKTLSVQQRSVLERLAGVGSQAKAPNSSVQTLFNLANTGSVYGGKTLRTQIGESTATIFEQQRKLDDVGKLFSEGKIGVSKYTNELANVKHSLQKTDLLWQDGLNTVTDLPSTKEWRAQLSKGSESLRQTIDELSKAIDYYAGFTDETWEQAKQQQAADQAEYERLLNLDIDATQGEIKQLEKTIEDNFRWTWSDERKQKLSKEDYATKAATDVWFYKSYPTYDDYLAGWEKKNSADYQKQQRENYEKGEAALRKEILAKEQDIKKAQLVQYDKLMDTEDFSRLSVPGASKRESTAFSPTDKGDPVYDYINDIGGYRDIADAAAIGTQYSRGHAYDYYLLSDKEIGLYNYLYAKKGRQDAEAYLDLLGPTLEIRKDEEHKEYLNDLAWDHPVLSSLLSVPASLAGSLAGAVDLGYQNIRKAFTGEPVNYHSEAQRAAGTAETLRTAVSEKVDNPVFSFLYNTIMSGADSLLAQVVTGGNSALASLLLGTSAGSAAARDIAARGGTDNQALMGGLMAGVFEGIFEKFSIGQFQALKETGKRGFKALVINVLRSAGVNASEEMATEIANIAYDTLALGDISNFELSIQNYIDQDIPESEAKSRTVSDFFGQVWEAGASGALMGAGFAGIGTLKRKASGAFRSQKQIENMLYSGTLKETMAQKIAQSPYLRQEFETVTGVKIGEKTAVSDILSVAKSYERQAEMAGKEVAEILHQETLSDADVNRILGDKAMKAAFESQTKASLDGLPTTKRAVVRKTWEQQRQATAQAKGAPLASGNNTGYTGGIEAGTENEVSQGGTGNGGLGELAKNPSTSSGSTVGRSGSGDVGGESAEAERISGGLLREEEKSTRTIDTPDGGRVGYTTVSAEDVTAAAQRTTQALRALGIAAEVASGPVTYTKDGVAKQGGENSTTLPDGSVVVQNSIDEKIAGEHTAAHEYYHSAKRRGCSAALAFESAVEDQLNRGDAETLRVMEEISNTYLGKGFPETEDEGNRVSREFTAYIAGALADNVDGIDFSGMFSDFGAVQSAFDALISEGRREGEALAAQEAAQGAGADGFANMEAPAQEASVPSADELWERTFARMQTEDGTLNGPAIALQTGRELGVKGSMVRAVAAVSKLTGRPVAFVDTLNGDGGLYDAGRGVIYLAADSKSPLLCLLGHELTHSLEGTPAYDELMIFVREQIRAMATQKGYTLSEIVQMKQAAYAERGRTLTEEGALKELVADWCGSMLFTDKSSIQKLCGEKPWIGRRVINWLKRVVKTLFGHPESAVLKRAEELYHNALMAPFQKGQGIQYSIDYTQNHQPVVVVEEDILSGVPRDQWIKTVKNVIHTRFSQGIPVHGRLVKVNRITKNEITSSKTSQYYAQNLPDTYRDKFKAAGNLDEIVLASTNYVNEDLKHSRKDSFKEFARGDVLLRIGKNDYNAKVIVGITGNHQMVLYDVIQFTPTNLKLKKEGTSQNTAEPLKATNDRADVPSDTSISQDTPDVNTSISENGRNDTQASAGEWTGKFAQDMDRLIQKYGRMVPGEQLADDSGQPITRDAAVPSRTAEGNRVSRFARTALESNALEGESQTAIQKNLVEGAYSYEPSSNQELVDKARETIAGDGYDQTLRGWLTRAQQNTIMADEDIALGELLLRRAGQNGNVHQVEEILALLTENATAAGRAVQAHSLLKRMTPEGRLLQLQRTVNQIEDSYSRAEKKTDLNREKRRAERRKVSREIEALEQRIGQEQRQGNSETVENLNREIDRLRGRLKELGDGLYIPEDCVQKILAQTTQEGLDDAVSEACRRIGEQIPSRWPEIWNAWRYLCMLFNPTTHIRNLVGNVSFALSKRVKDVVGAVIESSADAAKKAATGTGIERSKTLRANKLNKNAKEYYAFAKKDVKDQTVRLLLEHDGKYTTRNEILDSRKPFNRIQPLNALYQLNMGALEAEDTLFLNMHYKSSLVQYLMANKLDVHNLTTQQLQSARDYAILEAKKATFHDASKVADKIGRLAKTNLATEVLIEGALPFKKTPINILKRGVEYGPTGLIRAAYQTIGGIAKGKYSAAQVIDSWASGLTGTALCGLGYLLTSLGLVTGGSLGDSDREDKFQKMQGIQGYSLKIGGISYTIDFLSPAALPFFVGAELYSAFDKEAESSEKSFMETSLNILDSLGKVSEPMFSLSMLDGLRRVIESAKYTEGGQVFIDLASTMATSYFMQGFPTILSKIGRTIDDTRRTTYIPGNIKGAERFLENVKQTVMSKIPGLSTLKNPYIDAWGEQEVSDSTAKRVVENFVSPGYAKKLETTPTEAELRRLYESTGDNAALPGPVKGSFSVEGEKVYLGAEEYQEYATTRGRTAYSLLTLAMKTPVYKSLPDSEKLGTVEKIYDYANALAKASVSSYTLSGQTKDIFDLDAAGVIGAETCLAFLAHTSTLNSDKDEEGEPIKGKEKKDKVIAYIDSLPLSREQKDALYILQGYSEKTIHKQPWNNRF